MSVSSPAKTLTVNPAFLQEIKDSNMRLWTAFDELVRICGAAEESPAHRLRSLVVLLGELRDLLALQFALEETYGYMEVPTSIAPVNSHLMQDIRAQHCALYVTLNELTERGEELQYRGGGSELPAKLNGLIADVHEFELRFRDHERMEQDLIECSRPDNVRRR